MPTSLDFDAMSLRDFIALQQELEREVRRRFEKPVAFFFTDVVGSTSYIARYGDVAGRALLQRHHELLERTLHIVGGRVVDTAGDGAFCVAPTVRTGAMALMQLQNFILADNATVARKDQLAVRTGLHFGPALVDKEFVTGESVHTAARIMGTADGREIRVSRAAWEHLPPSLRARCTWLPPQQVKGIPEPVEMALLDWRPPERFPTEVFVVETGLRFPIPVRDEVTLGRLTQEDGAGEEHIVLKHADATETRRISRRQVALELTPRGYFVRALSRASTVVDGESLEQGQRVLVAPGAEVVLSRTLTLRLEVGRPAREPTNQRTMLED